MDKIKIEDNRKDDGDGLGVYGFVTIYSNHDGYYTVLNRTWYWEGKPTEVTLHDDSIEQVVLMQEGPTWTKKTKHISRSYANYTRTLLERRSE